MKSSRQDSFSRLALSLAAGTLGYAVIRLAQSQYNFRNRAVVITGGSRGLGLALARELARKGARLALIARSKIELERAASELRQNAAEVITIPCDIREESQVKEAIGEVVAHFGEIDVVINNAGEITVGPLSAMTLSDFDDAMALHFWAPLYMIMAALPHFPQQGGGRIVNIASFGGKVAVPHMAPYCASKFALVGLSDSLRAELAREDIHVTTVCPGLMRTGSHMNAFFKGDHRKEFSWFSAGAGLPTNSMAAHRAARQILAACQRGQAHLTVTIQARMAVLAQALFPNLFARAVMQVNRFLPDAAPGSGSERYSGWQSKAQPVAPSVMTRLADHATRDLNGMRGHSPAELESP